jgi:hypothetical protein
MSIKSFGGSTLFTITAIIILITFVSGIFVAYKLMYNNSAAKIISEQKKQIDDLTKELSNWKREFKTSSCRIIEKITNNRIKVMFSIHDTNGPELKPIFKTEILLNKSEICIEYKIIQFTNEKIGEGSYCLYMVHKVNGILVKDNPKKRYEKVLKKYNKKFSKQLIELLKNAEKYTDNEDLLKSGIRCKSAVSMTYEIREGSIYINSISSNGAIYHDELFM